MPDISMCPDTECPKALTCLRSERAGMEPSGPGQSWFLTSPRDPKDPLRCAYYMPLWSLGRSQRRERE